MTHLVIRLPLRLLPVRSPRHPERYREAKDVAAERIRDIARHFNLPVAVITRGGRSPDRRVLLARCLVAFTLREYEHLSYPEIARALGFRQHPQAIHLVRLARQVLADAELRVTSCDVAESA